MRLVVPLLALSFVFGQLGLAAESGKTSPMEIVHFLEVWRDVRVRGDLDAMPR